MEFKSNRKKQEKATLARLALVCLFSAFLFSTFPIYAQVDSITTLPNVEIQATSLRISPVGSDSKQWNLGQLDASQTADLAEFMAQQSPVFIKSYGAGSLATPSLRGGAAGHTAILWNGLPIQSPMLGLLDLSLLPTSFSDNINLQLGGGAALWGSGAIGGTLSLNNASNFNQKPSLALRTNLGSFGTKEGYLDLKLGNKRFQSQSRLLIESAKNDFSFRPAPILAIQKQNNAALKQQGLMQSCYFKIAANQELAAHIWLQHTAREIPPTLTQSRSQATQDDQSTRLILQYKNVFKTGIFQSKLGYFDEKIHYKDPIQVIDAPSRFRTYLSDFELNWSLNRQNNLLVGSTSSYTLAFAKAYAKTQLEFRTALFVSHRYLYKKWQIQSSIRQAFVAGKTVPFTPMFGVQFSPSTTLQFRSNVSRNYRLPTLNDRFWQPGGTMDLLPEIGWSAEMGLDFSKTTGNHTFECKTTVFNRRIKNWILWHKAESQSYWTATNVAEVWSRGLEQTLDYHFTEKNYQVGLQIQYAPTLSTNVIALNFPKIQAGEQLLYTPKHQLQGQLSWRWKRVFIAYQQRRTGAYQGVSTRLPSYSLADVRMQYEAFVFFGKISAYIKLNNLYNTDYRVVENRAMPGRSFMLGLQLSFSKLTKI